MAIRYRDALLALQEGKTVYREDDEGRFAYTMSQGQIGWPPHGQICKHDRDAIPTPDTITRAFLSRAERLASDWQILGEETEEASE
jgi:hypothetical protein